MTAPPTRAELEDDDYRAIARAVSSYWYNGAAVFRDKNEFVASCDSLHEAKALAQVLNGRAAVAEYERRRK